MKRKLVVWVVGEPGVGKTTLVRGILGPLEDYKLIAKPKWTVGDEFCAAGHYTGGTFDGADTVPYNGVKPALALWKSMLSDRRLTIFDGDRFSHAKAFEFFGPEAVDRLCVLLQGPEDLIQERRRQRAEATGRELQNQQWVKGRQTKAARFAETQPWVTRLTLDAAQPAEVLISTALDHVLNLF